MADATKQPESNNSHPLIVDTHLRANREKLFLMVVPGCILLIILIVNLKLTVPVFDNPYMINLIGGTCAFLTIIVGRRIMIPPIKSYINTSLSKNEDLPIEDQTVALFSSNKPISVFTFLQEFAKILIERGHKGITIRNCPPKDIAPIHPFNVTFEPLLLDEADETITELENSLDANNPRDDSAFPAGENLVTAIISPQLKRNIRIAGGWGIFILLFISALLLLILSFMIGGSIIPVSIVMISLLAIIFGVRAGSTQGRRKWLIVPGGFIVREGKFFSQGCQLHLFDRTTSVLILNKSSKTQWTLIAANENTFQRAVVTRKESELLLRAWLSPIPPPLIEQLSDLL